MYNRYVPQSDGSFHRTKMQESVNRQPERPVAETSSKPPVCPPPPQRNPQPPQPRPRPPHPEPEGGSITGFLKQLLPKGLDTGDLLIVILLLLMSGDCQEDQNTALLTLALYLFM